MISGLIFCIIFMPIVLSEPDLCRKPKLDSISYIPDKKMWFFTSGGYYWFIKEDEFPPGSATGKLPEGFSRGDAAFYFDFVDVCKETVISRQSNVKRTDQLVVMVEKVGDENQIIEFDTNTKNWSKSHSWRSDKVIGRANIDTTSKEEIDAIFTTDPSEVYVVQKTTYAAIEWKNLCSNPDGYVTAYQPGNSDNLQSSRDSYDSITVKDGLMYSFIGQTYWKSQMNYKNGNGQIVVSKGSPHNVSTTFFMFKECPDIGVNQNDRSNKTPEIIDSDQNIDNIEPAKEKQSNSDSSHSSGGSGYLLIAIIIVIIVVVVIITGVVVFVMRGKTDGKPKASNKVRTQQSKAKVSKK